MNKNIKRIIFSLLIIVLLVVTYFVGDSENKKVDEPLEKIQEEVSNTEFPTTTPIISTTSEPEKTVEKTSPLPQNTITVNATSETQKPVEKDKYITEPIPTDMREPVESQKVIISDEKMYCTISVRCDSILNNMSKLEKSKVDLIPKDGIILEKSTVEFKQGQSAFDLLLKTMKDNNIHMEYQQTPIYNSAYIEGINNIYEFDCGELSGWMYKVNDWVPNYGASRYQLKDGDKIEWIYTCDLGKDAGSEYGMNGER